MKPRKLIDKLFDDLRLNGFHEGHGILRAGIAIGVNSAFEYAQDQTKELIKALKWYASQDLVGNDGEEPCNLADRAKKALAEYEATK